MKGVVILCVLLIGLSTAFDPSDYSENFDLDDDYDWGNILDFEENEFDKSKEIGDEEILLDDVKDIPGELSSENFKTQEIFGNEYGDLENDIQEGVKDTSLEAQEDQRFKDYLIEDNRADLKDKDLIEESVQKELIPLKNNNSDDNINNPLVERESQNQLHTNLSALFATQNINENKKDDDDTVSKSIDETDENLEDIVNENSSIITNQTNLDNIIADAKKILAESDSSDLDNVESVVNKIKKSDESEDTVAKVRQDLNEDLNNLFQTWDKLTADDEKEVPKVFENQVKNLNKDDVMEINEDNKTVEQEIFEEVDFDTLFNNAPKETQNSTDEDKNKNYADFETYVQDIINDVGTDNVDTNILLKDISKENESKKTLNKVPKNEDELKSKTTIENLSSAELDEIMTQFKLVHANEFDDNSLKDSEPIFINLDGTEVTTITSPNYPNPYPTNQIVDWVIEGDGTGIELNITDFNVNGALGDYLLFKPGGVDASGEKGIIMSYHINEVKKFRFLNVNKMFVRFEAKLGMAFRTGFSFNVKIIFPPDDDTDVIMPTPEPLIPVPHHKLTVNLGGIPYRNFTDIQGEFKRLIADMAAVYINANGIEAENDTSSVTQITNTNFCNINWPGFESCVEVTFSVPVISTDEDLDSWRLNAADLRAMWYTYIYMDPFASRLKRMGFEEFHIPSDSAAMTWWVVASAATVAAVAALAFVLWRFSCLQDYTRMQVYSDTDSVSSKRALDLYPTPHQTLPPLYADLDYTWPAKEPDTRVEVPSYTNGTFVRDNLLDFDSDDEPATRDRIITSKGVNPEDEYQV